MVQIGWMVLGGIIGALGTALLTPRAGEEVRRELQERVTPNLDRGRIRATELMRSGRDALGSALCGSKQAAIGVWREKSGSAEASDRYNAAPKEGIEAR